LKNGVIDSLGDENVGFVFHSETRTASFMSKGEIIGFFDGNSFLAVLKY
jgi:hypothetical protein